MLKVEKQRIMRESIGKSTTDCEQAHSTNQASADANKRVATELPMCASTEGSNAENIASRSLNSSLEVGKNSSANGISSKASQDAKRPPRSSFSFFDR